MSKYQIYRGYEIVEHENNGSFVIKKNGVVVHSAASEDAAHIWIDDEKKKEFNRR